MQRTTDGSELLLAPSEVEGGVAVPSISRAAPGAHDAACPEPTEVVRHQALPLAEELRQLANHAVAAHELVKDAPSQGMRQQSHEVRRTIRGSA